MALILDEAAVRQVLSMDAAIETMEEALTQLASGGVAQPARTSLRFGPHDGYLGVMPAALRSPAAAGAKLVSIVEENADRDLPTHLATVMLIDPETGALEAVVDGRYITEVRTAAVSAVSARRLAREPAEVLGILGSGVQARSHLEALLAVRPARDVRVWSPTAEHRRRFAADMSTRVGVTVRAVDEAETAVRDADLVAIATSAREPIVRSEWVRDGTHVIAVGAYLPENREMDSDLVARGRLFVDSREAALAEAGDILIPIGEGRIDESHVVGELGEVLAGRVRGRTSDREVTIFKSVGMAVEDVATAALVHRRARAAGIGREIAT